MASSVAASLRALAASTPASLAKPSATPSPFLVLLAPTPPRRPLGLRSARRLPLAPLAASDSFESSVGVDYAEPAAAESGREEEEDAAARASAAVKEAADEGDGEEEVGEYVEPPEEAKVYVGNLPYDVDSERLAQLFEQAGVVEVSEVIYNRETDRSRGFGFVTMSTVEEAEKAVEMFHHYDINGRLLTVNKAAPRGSRVERPPRQFGGPSFRIYHGKVVDARVVYDRESGRSRGFGFVTMATQDELDDAIAALDGQSLDGRALRVNVAEERPRRGF
ncbi:hypothetical protein PVAP13_2NG264500 [Panicum virgatum]|uniref:RRM domain-containing protein n=1 Tax=Panicum virgatum TaxID=38727 RepID=A0A8T0VIT3_PANVG|nr:hypothetical protein PVAP13_2NG264500 [Panicum virgatum]